LKWTTSRWNCRSPRGADLSMNITDPVSLEMNRL
jgi:hypothetical protein